MAAGFVIFLREGVEASMIVALLLAYLSRLGRRDLFRDIFLGVGAALLLAGLSGVVIYVTVRSYAGTRAQTIFETATFVVAAAVLTYMTFWMRGHARNLPKELHERVDAVVDGRARTGLGVLAFQAVGREGLETVVFTLAIAFSASRVALFGGALLGLGCALSIAVVIYRLGHRLNLVRFFQAVGAVLMVFAAGLLADAVQNLQQLGWLPFLDHVVWHTGTVLSEDNVVGDILHSFFGYSQAPTILQVGVYVTYVVVVLAAFFGVFGWLTRRRDRMPAHAGDLAGSASSGGLRPPD